MFIMIIMIMITIMHVHMWSRANKGSGILLVNGVATCHRYPVPRLNTLFLTLSHALWRAQKQLRRVAAPLQSGTRAASIDVRHKTISGR